MKRGIPLLFIPAIAGLSLLFSFLRKQDGKRDKD